MINYVNCTVAEHYAISHARNTPAVIASGISKKPFTFTEHLAHVDKLKTDTSAAYWLVKKEIKDEILNYGVVSLTNINFNKKVASVGYYKIPNKIKGVGVELLNTLHYPAFTILNLNTLYADVELDNIASIKSLERAGYIKNDILYVKISKTYTIIQRYKFCRLLHNIIIK